MCAVTIQSNAYACLEHGQMVRASIHAYWYVVPTIFVVGVHLYAIRSLPHTYHAPWFGSIAWIRMCSDSRLQ